MVVAHALASTATSTTISVAMTPTHSVGLKSVGRAYGPVYDRARVFGGNQRSRERFAEVVTR